MYATTKALTAACAFLVALIGHAMAASQECAMTYETFELSVPHIDMEECPEIAVRESAFCRLSVGGEQAHLFYFDAEGDQCLLKVTSFEEGSYDFVLKPR